MKTKELVVLVEGLRCGILREESNGYHSFTYDTDLGSVPQLSLSMPRRTEPWTGRLVEAFIDGVLPDDPAMRERIGKLHEVNPRNPFALLTAIGLDCAGGAQFVAPDQLDDLQTLSSLQPISDGEIKNHLLAISDGRNATWQGENEHWSLNGTQDKIALRFQHGQWFEALGAAPTTHILKPGILALHEQAFNEYVCMKTIEALGIPAAQSDFRLFDGLPVLVSTRWDRKMVSGDNGTMVRRIHQEDLCQATAHFTSEKYQSYGGPGTVDIINALRGNGLDRTSVGLFHIALILNFLMAGSDAHAKNYAILEPVGQQPKLAPLYDIASMFAYDTQRKQRKLAMSIGGEYNWERIELRHWLRLAESTQRSDFDFLVAALRRYATALPDVFRATADKALKLSQTTLSAGQTTQTTRRKLVERIQTGIDTQCARVLHWFD